MAVKQYSLVEYREYPKQSMKTGYYVVNTVALDMDVSSEWWTSQCNDNNMLIEYGTAQIRDEEDGIDVDAPWTYTQDKDGVATTVTLPNIGIKIPKNDEWILPLIAYSS